MTEKQQGELFLQAGLTPCTHRGWGTAQHMLQAAAEGKAEESWGQSEAEETAGEVDKLQPVVVKKTWRGDMITAIRCKRALQHRRREERLPWGGSTRFTFQQGIFRSDRRMKRGLGRLQGRAGTGGPSEQD